MPNASVWASFCFEHWHCWPDAPEQFAYLASRHRHLFHVRVEAFVSRDRQIEFIDLRSRAYDLVQQQKQEPETATWSCESWCAFLLDKLPEIVSATCSEDGENGATITR